MLPPPTRISFASPCFVFTISIASSSALDISASPDILISCGTRDVLLACTRSFAYDITK
jgi:hypothetical protein